MDKMKCNLFVSVGLWLVLCGLPAPGVVNPSAPGEGPPPPRPEVLQKVPAVKAPARTLQPRIREKFNAPRLNENKWRTFGSTENVSWTLKNKCLYFNAKFAENDGPFALCTTTSLEPGKKNIELRVTHCFSGQAISRSTQAVSPVGIIQINDLEKQKAAGFWVARDRVWVIGTPEGAREYIQLPGGLPGVRKQVKEIKPDSVHKYKIVYNPPREKVSFWIDAKLVYELKKIKFANLRGLIGVGRNCGREKQVVKSAWFSNFLLQEERKKK